MTTIQINYPNGEILVDENDTHANPSPGTLKFYAKTDGKFYSKDSSGTETSLGGSGGTFPTNQIVFGTGTGSSSSANLTYDDSVKQLTITDSPYTLTARVQASSTLASINSTSVDFALSGGAPFSSSLGSRRSSVLLGNSSNGVSIYGWDSTSIGAPNGGPVSIVAGESYQVSGNTTGAAVTISASQGSPAGGVGGAISISAGPGGSTTGNGGNVTLAGGTVTSGIAGLLIFKTANTTRFTIDDTGTWLLAGLSGTIGQILTSNGSGAPPTWQTFASVSFPLLGTNGSAVAPTYSFSGATGSGMYMVPTNNLTFAVAGGAKWFIDGSTGAWTPFSSGTYNVGQNNSPVLTLFANNIQNQDAVIVTGNGANLAVRGGNGGATSGNGGNVTISGGTVTSGTPGFLLLRTANTDRLEVDPTGAWLLAGAAGSTGQALVSNGAGTPPTWQSVAGTPTTGQVDYNFNMNNQVGYAITTSLATSGVVVASGHRGLIRTILVTNLSGAQATLNADINYGGVNAVVLASNMPIPATGSVDLDLKMKVMSVNDVLRFQANANSTLHVTVVWEDNTDTKFVASGTNLTTTSVTDLFTSAGANGTVIESILVVNNSSTVQNVPVQVYWTDGSNVIQGYYCFNLVIAYGGSIELLVNPVRIPTGFKVRAQATVANTIAVHVSGKNVL